MDPERLGGLLDRHADALELYARQWCETPEDVVQEAFVALAALAQEPENPAAWLFRVVRNGAINAAQSARRRRRHEAQAAVESCPWFEPDPSLRNQDSIDPDQAEAELGSLPIEQREIIVARLWGGLTFEQVAALAGCSSSTAHRLYQNGLKTLRERLGVTCPNPNPNPNSNRSRPIPS
ncbi:N/A [soil metagenome]